MSTANRSAPRFRVGDWVSVLYGPRTVLAQVVENRGPIGVGGRHLYGIRLDRGQEESEPFEVAEDDLEPVTEAELASWRNRGTLALHQTITYHAKEADPYGKSKPRYPYLVVAKSGTEPGSGVASILSLLPAQATGIGQDRSPVVATAEGGPEAALRKAEEYLDAQHPGLKKTVGEMRP